ncbi:M36 family metallopeptidase [Aquimarina sp. RZ0]|uniref:M36 family metallopeptidase n=1 Tax=Aquimarina sp. RZ0 TaxID=2607730 RepID=UPI0011F22B40|nr:M36 family metallopeptidase [Aquimarina sp. RZ0]KAA1245038.1 T9SS type A sorting domain-containing protein [Aquimarina sp. RZ0]
MKKMYAFVFIMFIIGQTMFSQNQNNIKNIVDEYFKSKISFAKGNFTESDFKNFIVTDVVPSLNPNIQHVYVQQQYDDIPIQFATYKLTVENNQDVIWEINQFVPDASSRASIIRGNPISVEDAIRKVIQSHNLKSPLLSKSSQKSKGVFEFSNTGMSSEPIQVDQVYMLHNDELVLTWRVNVYQEDGQHWWNENVDASSGKIIHTEDWVISCNFGDASHETHGHGSVLETKTVPTVEMAPTAALAPDSYNVFPIPVESPNHGNRAIVNDPANTSASPFGWHDTNGRTGAEFTITRGNNVWAQDDSNGNNGTGFAPDGGGGLDFNFPLNFNQQPSSYRSAAITNLFYWNNIMHDIWYQYGFDEASGNFQENNYGNGGRGSDSVSADAQDGSGTNNANFGTPPDGSNPRMQMFLWTNPTRDGDFDNVVIAHEYGHGISTRLVGGPSRNALGGSEQMGEGWSDWFGLMITLKPGDNGRTGRGVGTYVTGQPTTGRGIRPTQYSTDRRINDTDYADVNSLRRPHGVGYGFATILWDMTWALIDQEGFDSDFYNGTGGNNIAMALVIEGLKNTANNPGYVAGRDGILRADQDLYGGRYECLIWGAFAARGVGQGANENNNGGTNGQNDQTVSFVNPCDGGGGNQAPTVSFAQPTNNQVFDVSTTLSVTVNATDSDGSIANVRLFLNGNLVRQENFVPYEWGGANQSDTSLQNLRAGTYSLRAVATDNDGATSENTITVIVRSASASHIAVGKPATQSSLGFGGVPSRAVDGNTNGNYRDSSVTHTNREVGWWRVDLQAVYNISSINVYNRTDCCTNRISGASVYVGLVNSTNPTDYVRIGDLNDIARNAFPNIGRRARYIMVRRNNSNFLSLAEVEVQGTLAQGNSSVATVYADCNFNGQSATFGVGTYNFQDFIARFPNDQLSSIRVPSGLKATIYQHSLRGRTLELTGDNSCLTNESFNDLASSIKIEASSNLDDSFTGTDKEVDPEALFTLYPNPTSDVFEIFVSTTSTENMTATIYDILGSKKAQVQLIPGVNSISTKNFLLGSGIYLIKIKSQGEEPVLKKLVIQ